MHVLYRFEGQGVILEQEVCSTNPLKLKVQVVAIQTLTQLCVRAK